MFCGTSGCCMIICHIIACIWSLIATLSTAGNIEEKTCLVTACFGCGVGLPATCTNLDPLANSGCRQHYRILYNENGVNKSNQECSELGTSPEKEIELTGPLPGVDTETPCFWQSSDGDDGSLYCRKPSTGGILDWPWPWGRISGIPFGCIFLLMAFGCCGSCCAVEAMGEGGVDSGEIEFRHKQRQVALEHGEDEDDHNEKAGSEADKDESEADESEEELQGVQSRDLSLQFASGISNPYRSNPYRATPYRSNPYRSEEQ